MKKYIVLGVNENPKYLYYLPLVVWAWKQFGWDAFIFYTHETKFFEPIGKHINLNLLHCIKPIKGYKTETIAQVSRMYACLYCVTYDLLMTSDADIIPLSNYWLPNENEITCYGRDLSNEHQPMCFVAAKASVWGNEIMRINPSNTDDEIIKNDLDAMYLKAKNKWCVDQDILTANLNRLKNKTLINRGTDPKTHYPIGRVDRSAWTLNHKTLIDCHAPHDILTNDESFRKVMQLLHTVWPKEDFKWIVDYTKEFKKLL